MDHHPSTTPISRLSFFYPKACKSTTIKYAVSFLFLLASSLIVLILLDPFRAAPLSDLLFSAARRVAPQSSPDDGSGKVCDYSLGRWVRDETAPHRSYTEDCRFLDAGFQCRRNGRVDGEYLNWRWKPDGCEMPRFNGTAMLEKLRDKRVVFAGDSIGRNQWESLVCMLAKDVVNQSSVYERHGKPITKHKGDLSILFEDHNATVEYHRVPFLVPVGRPPPGSPPEVRRAIRVDRIHWMSNKWVGADVIVFNAGHWWNEEKTVKMGVYFQEGDRVNTSMGIPDAFRRTLRAWREWVVSTSTAVRPKTTHVFFRSYSPVHFLGGTWDEGGHCDLETKPKADLGPEPEPWYNAAIADAVEELQGAGTTVDAQVLNVTYLTEFRVDGHPSRHREPGTPELAAQDCSHWCLPGVPDTWNQMLYAYLVAHHHPSPADSNR